ncbi:hypothetical protein [Labrys wisconsinensis]|uniref:Uncharacterized protein n=1 Tax=Labrys wisconsinensis TaxID=425677 RepID=A0ABU0JG04_9HYPH|nr:hypothetical protein [Labrys wisconsinensis]MDQ0473210.1 hypothetical protein [Labrys wisconsinensis]
MPAQWTTEEIDRMGELRSRGLTRAEIGAAMGRTKSAVASCLKRRNKAATAGMRRRFEAAWDAEEEDGSPVLEAACRAHLEDLEASGGRWTTYAIAALPRPPRHAEPLRPGLFGSPAALCADL